MPISGVEKRVNAASIAYQVPIVFGLLFILAARIDLFGNAEKIVRYVLYFFIMMFLFGSGVFAISRRVFIPALINVIPLLYLNIFVIIFGRFTPSGQSLMFLFLPLAMYLMASGVKKPLHGAPNFFMFNGIFLLTLSVLRMQTDILTGVLNENEIAITGTLLSTLVLAIDIFSDRVSLRVIISIFFSLISAIVLESRYSTAASFFVLICGISWLSTKRSLQTKIGFILAPTLYALSQLLIILSMIFLMIPAQVGELYRIISQALHIRGDIALADSSRLLAYAKATELGGIFGAGLGVPFPKSELPHDTYGTLASLHSAHAMIYYWLGLPGILSMLWALAFPCNRMRSKKPRELLLMTLCNLTYFSASYYEGLWFGVIGFMISAVLTMGLTLKSSYACR